MIGGIAVDTCYDPFTLGVFVVGGFVICALGSRFGWWPRFVIA
jgi:hypothetical protein